MNYIQLVESGAYNRNDLKPEQESYIKGMEEARESVDAAAFHYLHPESTLEKIESEVAGEVLKEIKRQIYADICEAIVSFLDANAGEKE